ncbi:MAG: cell division ATP-binding protein FtsE [Candidatus Taylorbacteria bacterium RIFCSPLOWO2_02_FULL_43_11]|uniref:Cell division ATP-binding protein FtsE n=1 Tax=Candidatus Taylorbacteria bacterium RIFCSPHIGHO2_02_FULL_43_32b TaxID=1802306 RepID=A0A1G2MEN7_9BACT|nr:MAG: cell division ATP-binding protein FtsE [Candidatus Taylorbacteria bacterium RIFCSPHIGHO2_01_FULL_43_47]OHA22293.1 MAG: cell division ATP-binding protein FtsE [Candidatus Taylorbacteria bacterium RIFCSPHIGHO2_02_FULL_43_32b]OHA29326.1 MAG: cell division ATP-binding protein FtsE [Candidatus Taylorbacteria bacterium RIFCSPLOWO2_01_FULL_43_44]OHA36460.1 MAG: cell division ATP-binding protein FtsE [Candidatus Taylorbacteria bacterium RIFCSPLOWO2_02_FULL_43_11]
MIHFDKVTKVYPDKSVALKEVSFNVQPAEFVSVVGHSGAGKTTLIKMILAEERPTSGVVFFQQVDIHSLLPRAMNEVRRKIGAVFQDFRLLPNKNAYENIAFAMEAAGRTDEEIASDVPHVLDLVGLSHKMRSFPHELSGGERQRIGIARAIVNQPDVILADEPTGNLDPLNTHEIIQILKKINDLGTTVILTTHNKGVIDSLGRRVVTMEEGRIVRDDPTGRYVL